MSIKVNGINYGWGDVDVKIPGLNLVVQEMRYLPPLVHRMSQCGPGR